MKIVEIKTPKILITNIKISNLKTLKCKKGINKKKKKKIRNFDNTNRCESDGQWGQFILNSIPLIHTLRVQCLKKKKKLY